MSKQSKKLSAIELNKIIKIFQEKDWMIDETNENSLYNRYKNRYISLKTKEERDFFLSISKEYKLVNLNDYNRLLIGILNTIFKGEDRKDLLVFPLLTKKDITKIKSSTFMCYLFNHVSINYYDNLHKKNFTIVGNYEILEKK